MKKLSLIAALTLSTMLSACGGGGGGGHSFVPPTSFPDITNPDTPVTPPAGKDLKPNHNDEVSEMNTNVVRDNAGLDTYLNSVLSAGTQTAQAKMKAKAPRKAPRSIDIAGNQKILNNMVRVILDKELDTASLDDIKQALLVAGFTSAELDGNLNNLNDAKNWIKNNYDAAKNKAENVVKTYADLNINNAKLNLVTLHEDKQNSFVKLTLDDNNRIDGVEITKNKGMAGEVAYKSDRNGDTNEFKTNQKIYRYGINSKYYTGTFIESLTELSPEEQRDKLKARVDELAATGVYDSDESNPREKNVAELKDAIDKALGFNDASTLDVDVYEGDVRDVGSESDKFEYCHMNYTKDETTTYKSYAKDMKLVYSDFGTLAKNSTFSKPVLEGLEKESFVFAGGYEDKKIEVANLSEDMTFSGKAVGAVNVAYGENGGSEDRSMDPLNLEGKATLTFDKTTAQQTLTAEFGNWYDVTAEVAANSNPSKLTLNNWKSGTADDYKFRDQSEYIVNDFTTAKQLAADPNTAVEAGEHQHSDPAFGALNIGYYGNDNMPTEATGYLYYEEARGYNKSGLTKEAFEQQHPDMPSQEIDDKYYDMVKNISVNIGFGTQRQN